MGTMTAVSEHRNLKPWKPGRSGNLNGRPVGRGNARHGRKAPPVLSLLVRGYCRTTCGWRSNFERTTLVTLCADCGRSCDSARSRKVQRQQGLDQATDPPQRRRRSASPSRRASSANPAGSAANCRTTQPPRQHGRATKVGRSAQALWLSWGWWPT